MRDPAAVFFAGLLPVGLFALVGANNAAVTTDDGVPLTVFLAAGMISWGVAVTCLMNIPEAVVQARDRGVLKRLRGTPLTPALYVAGRVAAGLVLGTIIAALVLALGAAAYDMPVTGLLPGLGVLVLGSVTLTACGLLLAAAVRNARSFGAVALMVLLPMSFVSDVFSVGGPEWMETVGTLLPLKHLQNALTDVFAGTAGAARGAISRSSRRGRWVPARSRCASSAGTPRSEQGSGWSPTACHRRMSALSSSTTKNTTTPTASEISH